MPQLIELTLDEDVTLPVEMHLGEGDLDRLPLDLTSAWQQADQAGAAAATKEAHGQAIGLQCRCALLRASLTSQAEIYPPSLIATLVQRGDWTTERAVTWLFQMSTQHRQAETIVELAPFLMETDWARIAPLMRVYIDHHQRSWLFFQQQILDLIPHLPQLEQNKVIRQVVADALQPVELHDPDKHTLRRENLARVCPLLNDTELDDAIRTARNLPPELEKVNSVRSEALSGLLPELARRGSTDKALELMSAIPPHLQGRAVSLLGIARHQSDVGEKRELLLKSRQAAELIDYHYWKNQVLTEIATALAEAGYLEKAQETVKLIGGPRGQNFDPPDHNIALAQLIAFMPEEQARETTHLLRGSYERGARTDLLELIRSMMPALARFDDINEALRCLSRVSYDDLIPFLKEVTPKIVTPGYGQQLLDYVLSDGFYHYWLRYDALAVLARYFPEPLADRAFDETIERQPAIRDKLLEATSQIWCLAALGRRVSESRQPTLAKTILDHARSLSPGQLHGEALDDWLWSLEEVLTGFSNLPPPLREKLGQVYLDGSLDYGDPMLEAEILASVISSLEEPLRSRFEREIHAKVEQVEETLRWVVLSDILPLLPESDWPPLSAEALERVRGKINERSTDSKEATILTGSMLSITLQQVRRVNSGYYGGRAEKLKELVPSLLALSEDEQHTLWVESLHELASNRTRISLLYDLRVLAPVIESLGGAEGAEAVVDAVLDVCRWLP